MTNPVAGREDEYNDWYQHTHLPQLMQLPGFVAAQRYRTVATLGEGEHPYKYMAEYEIETDDVQAAIGELMRASAEGRITMTGVIDTDDKIAVVYEEFGERVAAAR